MVIVTGSSRHRHRQQLQMLRHPGLHLETRRPKRRQRARSAAQHRHEDARLRVMQPLDMSAQFVNPRADLVAKRRRHRVLPMSPTGARIVRMTLRQRRQPRQHLSDLAQDDPVRLAQLEDVARLRDVLRRRAPMHITADLAAQDAIQLPDQRHQRMRGHGQTRLDLVDVEQIETAAIRDLDRRISRNHAEFRFGPRQRSLHVKPGLPAGLASEQGANPRIGHAGGGWSMLHRRLLTLDR